MMSLTRLPTSKPMLPGAGLVPKLLPRCSQSQVCVSLCPRPCCCIYHHPHRSVTRHQILLSDSLQVVKCDCCEFIQIGKRGSPAALLGVSLSQIKGKAHIGVESPYYIGASICDGAL